MRAILFPQDISSIQRSHVIAQSPKFSRKWRKCYCKSIFSEISKPAILFWISVLLVFSKWGWQWYLAILSMSSKLVSPLAQGCTIYARSGINRFILLKSSPTFDSTINIWPKLIQKCIKLKTSCISQLGSLDKKKIHTHKIIKNDVFWKKIKKSHFRARQPVNTGL